jgi:hypothetical protein
VTDAAIASWATPYLPEGFLGIPGAFDALFWAFKRECISTGSEVSPDSAWVTALNNYLSESSTPESHKAQILLGKGRDPTYYHGGLVLSLNSGANAMTLDDCVFVHNLEPNTYVHEMVHVGQYGMLGPEQFLATYFGSAAIVVIERWVRGQPTDPMTASPLETAAYEIGTRFQHEKFP